MGPRQPSDISHFELNPWHLSLNFHDPPKNQILFFWFQSAMGCKKKC